jgi:outer membrane protein TolC
MYRTLLYILSFALMPLLAGAQEPISLADAIERGLAHNYQLQLSRAAVAVAENNNDWSLAGKYPAINLNLNSNNTYNNTNNPASIVRESSVLSNGMVPSVTTSWILFDGYRVNHTKDQLAAQVELSETELRSAVQNTVQTIMQTYHNALVQQEQLAVLKEVLKLSRDRIEYQEVRREYGQANTFDLLQVQDAYLNDSTNYLVQLNNYENALRSLKLAMGEDLGRAIVLTDELVVEDNTYVLDELWQKMLSDNPDLRTQVVNQQLAAINTRLQETTRYPSISLNAGLQYTINLNNGSQTFQPGSGEPFIQDLPGIASRSWQGFLNFSATYTLWDAGARRRRIETASLQEVQAQRAFDNLAQNLRTQLANTLATYNNQRRLVQLTNELLDNARRNLAIAEERFRGGLINSFDYRSIQLSYINANQARLNALLNLKNTEVDLLRLTGGLIR